jgi:hypothetical protein
MLRNCFLREEGDDLILGSGIPRIWLQNSTPVQPLILGPAPTKFGVVTVTLYRLTPHSDTVRVEWNSQWHSKVPDIVIHLPGCDPFRCLGSIVSTEIVGAV